MTIFVSDHKVFSSLDSKRLLLKKGHVLAISAEQAHATLGCRLYTLLQVWPDIAQHFPW